MMFIVLGCFVASIALALLLPSIWHTADGENGSSISIHRYRRRECALPLYLLPIGVYIQVLGFWCVASGYPHIINATVEVVILALMLCTQAGAILVYKSMDAYRAVLERNSLQVITLFRSWRVGMQSVRQIANVRGSKCRRLFLFDEDDRLLAQIEEAIEGYDELVASLEARTRSSSVLLFRSEDHKNWEERPNDTQASWRPSRGPLYLRRLSRRIGIYAVILIVGAASIMIVDTVMRHSH